MFFDYNNVSFDINERYVTEKAVKQFFTIPISLAKKVNIWEINVEDDTTSYIYLEKIGDINSWDAETIDYVTQLQNNGFFVMYADEDYGDDFDVIIIYNNINTYNLLDEFERIIILKTLIFNVNLNFLNTDDLKNIDYAAFDMGITEFPAYELDGLYNSEIETIESIYNDYQEFALNRFMEIKNGLMEVL